MQSSIHPATSGGLDETAPAARALTDTLRDLVQLTKPRVTWMVLVTTACGAFAAPGTVGISRLSLMLLGLSLVVGSANAFNMYLERDTDAAMRRTRERPLPAGRLAPEIALVFAGALAVVGLLGVTLLVNPVCGLLSAAALGTYVLLYTPLKRLTPWALHVGAVPGAIPPLIGWASVTGSLNFAALTLFLILLVWQLPHFLAIAIFRQSDYEAAGLRVLPAVKGLFAAKLEIVLYAVLLLGASVLPVYAGIAGPVYLGVALALGLAFAGFSLYGLRRDSGTRWARRLFFASMPYLILVFGALVIAAA
jgi:protoheme IX farnesyltransferase